VTFDSSLVFLLIYFRSQNLKYLLLTGRIQIYFFPFLARLTFLNLMYIYCRNKFKAETILLLQIQQNCHMVKHAALEIRVVTVRVLHRVSIFCTTLSTCAICKEKKDSLSYRHNNYIQLIYQFIDSRKSSAKMSSF
jgi:hypothetical protein